MKESVLSYVQKCNICGTTYIEEIGETCNCPAPMFEDEDFDDKIKPELHAE